MPTSKPASNQPVSEENQPVVGMHRSTDARYCFWLETSENASANSLPNPSAPNDDENFVVLDIVQNYSISEDQAVTITPTQGGGKLIEDRGMILKEVTLSGTTGYLPTPSSQQSSVGPQQQIKGSGGLPLFSDSEAHERSGYKRIIELRNLFRRYAFIMRYGTPRQRKQTRMHFLDTFLGDYWIIQPLNITTSRVSPRNKFTYDYTIRFKTLAPSSVFPTDNPTLPEDMAESTTGIQEIGTTRASTALGTISQQAQRTSLTDRLRQLQSDIRDKTQTLSASAMVAVNSYLNTVDNFIALFALPALAVRDLVTLSNAVLARVENSIEGLLGVYELNANTFDPNTRFWNETYLEARATLEAIVAQSTVIFGETGSERLLRENQKWIAARGLDATQVNGGASQRSAFLTGGGLNNTRSDSLADAIELVGVQVQLGDSIFTLSQRATGTIHKHPDIVAINGLVPPFIINDTSGNNRRPGVLYPGDTCYVPVANTKKSVASLAGETQSALAADRVTGTLTGVGGLVLSDSTKTWRLNQWIGYTVTIGNETRVITASGTSSFTINRLFTVTPTIGVSYLLQLDQFSGLSRIPTADELTYGRDVMLTFDFGQSGTEKCASGALSASGDFATVTGLDNWIQWLRIVMATEQGRNIFHPTFGNPMPVGQKMLLSTFQFYKLLLVRSIISDPRTSKVVSVNASMLYDVMSTSITVVPVSTSQPQTIGLSS